MKELVPLFVKLDGRRALVVGGGAMAAQRVRQLAAAGARVVVVAPEVRPEIVPLAAEVHRRPFVAPDLNGAWLCVAAAPAEVNREVARAAEARRVFVNAVDDVAAASAYCAGVVRKDGVVLAVSTEGRAPALAGLLREALEALLPADVAGWTALAERLRSEWKAAKVPMGERRPLLLRALNALYEARPLPSPLPSPRPSPAPLFSQRTPAEPGESRAGGAHAPAAGGDPPPTSKIRALTSSPSPSQSPSPSPSSGSTAVRPPNPRVPAPGCASAARGPSLQVLP